MEDWFSSHPLLTVCGFAVAVLFFAYKMLSVGKTNPDWMRIDWSMLTVASIRQQSTGQLIPPHAFQKLRDAWQQASQKHDEDYFGEHFTDAVHAARFTEEEAKYVRELLHACSKKTLCNFFELGLRGTYMDNFTQAIRR
jgi:hypothetical protein